jgi:hypothetical protein
MSMQYSEQGNIGPGQLVQQAHEPILTYDQQTGQWSGANRHFSVWMDDATFRSYAAVWYEETTWLADRPLAERRAAAIARCQRLSYWDGCERNYDQRVHITYH